MIQRVRQFFRALHAHLSENEKRLVAAHLNEEERRLFYAMHPIDQAHAVHVAETAARLADEAEEQGCGMPREFLLRCALLHDVGRVKGDLDLWGKVWAVLAHHYLPKLSRRLADGKCVHFLYVYYHHAEIGAEKLRAIGDDDIADVIRWHHSPAKPGDGMALNLLREADERN